MDHDLLNKQLASLSEGVGHPVSILANAAALLYGALPDINWAGFYLLEDGGLYLGPFMGKPACVEIPLGRGVCGTAAKENRTVLVPDVHAFEGHIACDCDSNSEIVIPLNADGRLYGVLDIDSPVFDRFSEEDRRGLEEFASVLCAALGRG